MTTLTHLEFRRRFTLTEQEFSDELEATFETNPMLSTEQKRKLRTGYKNFYAATVVDTQDPDIPPILGLYEAIGILGAGRAEEILREAPVEPVPVPTVSIGAYLLENQITVISEGETPPESFSRYWPLSPEVAALLDAGGAQIRVNGDALEIISVLS